jgi:pseudouridine kinase
MDRLPAELRGVRCLIANEDELAAAAGLASARHAQTRREAWQRLRARGLQQLVVTAGARGAYFSRGATLQHLPALPVQLREVSGAGDAFAAGVCAALHRDADDLVAACQLGLQLAALTLQTEASVSPALSPALLAAQHEETQA